MNTLGNFNCSFTYDSLAFIITSPAYLENGMTNGTILYESSLIFNPRGSVVLRVCIHRGSLFRLYVVSRSLFVENGPDSKMGILISVKPWFPALKWSATGVCATLRMSDLC